MNRAPVFCILLLGLGIFLWMQRDAIVAPQSDALTARPTGDQAPVGSGNFIIREKVKPGGYIGWHTSERDTMTQSPRQTRQASDYYFVCTEVGSGTRQIFQVSASAFNMERVGNVLTAQQVRGFTSVSEIHEPDLPANFEFRRRD